MGNIDVIFVYVVVKRVGSEEHLINDHSSRLPIFFKDYAAIKVAKRMKNCIVREIRFDLFDWKMSNSGKTIYIDPSLISSPNETTALT